MQAQETCLGLKVRLFCPDRMGVPSLAGFPDQGGRIAAAGEARLLLQSFAFRNCKDDACGGCVVGNRWLLL